MVLQYLEKGGRGRKMRKYGELEEEEERRKMSEKKKKKEWKGEGKNGM